MFADEGALHAHLEASPELARFRSQEAYCSAYCWRRIVECAGLQRSRRRSVSPHTPGTLPVKRRVSSTPAAGERRSSPHRTVNRTVFAVPAAPLPLEPL
jgi:hypothetical protein